MRGWWVDSLSKEDGRSLPAVLIALTVGVLLITPLLSGSSTGLLATRAADQALLEQFSLDAGVEFGIWRLRYDPTFRALIDSVPLTPRNVGMAALNGYTPGVTAMALNTTGWERLEDALDNVSVGGALAIANAGGNDYLFAFRGGNGVAGRAFWRYTISTDGWIPRASVTANKGDGAALAWNEGDYIYAFRGNNQRTFWRYRISTNGWQTCRQAPARVNGGGSLAYANGSVYAFRGGSQPDFWRFDPGVVPTVCSAAGGATWTSLADAPGDVGPGGALVYAGANTFYALQGGGGTGFWRYSSGAWTVLADTPAAVDNGGAVTFAGGFVYAFQGDNSLSFWRYSPPPVDAWTVETNTPGAVQDGGSLAYDNAEYIYGLRGNNNPDLWRYRVAPPQYDIVAQSGARTITSRIQISGTNVTILFWDVQ